MPSIAPKTAVTNVLDPRRFLGRDVELATLLDWYGRGVARAAVVGPPGVGKTRLIEALCEQCDSGVIYCDLDRAENEAAAWARLACALKISLVGTPTEQHAIQIGAALEAHAGQLLILDHTEGLDDWLVGLLSSVPADLLVWSVSRIQNMRGGLRPACEHTLLVEPFSCSSAGGSSETAAMLLWEHWARLVQPSYSLREDDPAAVAAIIKRLDGVPLAIKLAASRLHILGTEGLLLRLEESLDVLSTGTDGLDRALVSSWRLLDTQEQRVLVQCSVFRGTFDARAAEQIVDAYGDDHSPTTSGTSSTTLAILTRLRDASFLATSAKGDQSRLHLWFSVGEFAGKQLDYSKEIEAARDRHAVHYGRRACDYWAEIVEWGDLHRPDLVAADQGNFVAAVEQFIGRGERDDAAWMLLVLGHLAWDHRLPTPGLLRYLDAVLALTPEQTLRASAELAHLFLVRSKLLVIDGKERAAIEDIRRAQVIARHGQNAHVEALALEHMGRLLVRRGDLVDGLAVLRSAESFAKGIQCDTVCIRVALDLGARAALLGDLGAAKEFTESVLGLHSGQYTPRWRVIALRRLGEIAADEGRIGEALRFFDEACRFWDVVSKSSAGWYAWLALDQGDASRAVELFRAAMNAAEVGGATRDHGQCALGLALAQWRTGETHAVDTHLETTVTKIANASDGHRALAFSLRAWLGRLEGRSEDVARFASEATALLSQIHDVRRRHLVELVVARAHGGTSSDWDDDSIVGPATRLLAFRVCRELGRSTTLSSRAPQVEIDAKGQVFTVVAGETIDLRRRPVLRRLLTRLIDAHQSQLGVCVSNDDLIAAGWPGEKIIPQAALARLYVSVQRLRQAGLGNLIEAAEGGYRIGTEVRVVRK